MPSDKPDKKADKQADKRAAMKPPHPAPQASGEKQVLHLVFGGELENLNDIVFHDMAALDIVGIFPDYQQAEIAWKAAAQRTVDNAHMRYFIVDLHRMMSP